MSNNIQHTEKSTLPDITVKFYCPLRIRLCEYDEYGCVDYESESEFGGKFANQYKNDIKECMEWYTEDDDCDMAEYFDGSSGAAEKLKSAVWGFESKEGILYGCITAKLTARFTPEEEAEFKEWCVGQNADGIGEGFEQQDIKVRDGVMYVSYWHHGDDYFLDNEDEFGQRINGNMVMGGM